MIGRAEEMNDLNRLYSSKESEFVAIYGRRRVGKTYLVNELFDEKFAFKHTGLNGATKARQLRHFFLSLKEYGCKETKAPADWFEAFDYLKRTVAANRASRKVVFIDELPWMDTPKSDFLVALGTFWNGWCDARKDILFIICGSASSWIVNKIFRDRGGLHNRVTWRMKLMPFTLQECEQFFASRGVAATRRDIAEYYMAMGGIPYYLKYVTNGRSAAQNIDSIFFVDNAPLKNEFAELYSSLFKDSESYMKIVSALAAKQSGMTRKELSDASKIETGRLSKTLETLEESGFIRSYRSFGNRKRGRLYQLIDNFTLFHFRFLEGRTDDNCFWTSTVLSSTQAVWRGLAFERLCLQHVQQMRNALGIRGVHMETYGWRHEGNDVYPKGVQIDLILDRADNVINICEMKYSNGEYSIDSDTADELIRKAETFKSITGTSKAVHITLVTSKGIAVNAYFDTIQSQITLDDLFK